MRNDDRSDAPVADAPRVGDHLALDLLNTHAHGRDGVIDHWRTGEDVRRWLERHDVVPPARDRNAVPADLLAQARTLRAQALELIAGRKAGRIGDVGALNARLRAHVSAPQLVHGADGRLTLVRVADGDAVASLLGPVAEAVADLLVTGDFALVKQCEHPDCILWFYDRTKSHRRRWCSMALCGNRQKAARFRKQKRDGGD